MPVLTVESVDSDTDTIKITGHGLNTGAGPCVVRRIGNGLSDPLLPSPLAEDSAYWVIRVDDDHVKLAISSANAMAGTAIDLTTNGTGSHVLAIGLPYARARTYVPSTVSKAGSQVRSDDLNALQDQAKTSIAKKTLVIHGAAFQPHSSSASFTRIIGGIMGAPPTFYAPLALPIGARILEVRLLVTDNPSPSPTTIAARLSKYTAATDMSSTVATSPASDGSGSYQVLTVPPTAEVVASGITYMIHALEMVGSNACTVHGAEVDWDMLPGL